MAINISNQYAYITSDNCPLFHFEMPDKINGSTYA
jgi:hypothetical protein